MITFQADAELQESIRAAAKKQDRAVSNFIRQTLKGAVGRK